jgi:hypothetical protein
MRSATEQHDDLSAGGGRKDGKVSLNRECDAMEGEVGLERVTLLTSNGGLLVLLKIVVHKS